MRKAREKTPAGRLAATGDKKPLEQAQKDCDWISIYGWDWWRQVVSDAERASSGVSREDDR